MTDLNLMKKVERILWEKEKLLVTSNDFPSSHERQTADTLGKKKLLLGRIKYRILCRKIKKMLARSIFSSTGQRPASNCHGVVSVVCPFLQKISPQKLSTGFLRNFTGMFLRWSSFKFLLIIVFYEEFWLPWRSK